MTEIKSRVYDKEGLLSLRIVAKAKKNGNSAGVLLPKELLGKEVIVTYERKNGKT